MDVAPGVAATLGFAAGLALDAALRQVTLEAAVRSGAAVNFALKWPNDVLAEGKKISGILLEAERMPRGLAVVTGMGTNVVAFPEGTPTPATSLSALGIQVSAEVLFAALSDAWVDFLRIWDNGRGFEQIRQLWLARAAGLGQAVAVVMGGSTIEGIFDTIDDQGCMIIRTPAGKRMPVSAGDVHFGTAASRGTS
jgi:BirA family biotin operon repressor/biotin-[acetyl-CoA-carboxylase] ligase